MFVICKVNFLITKFHRFQLAQLRTQVCDGCWATSDSTFDRHSEYVRWSMQLQADTYTSSGDPLDISSEKNVKLN